MSTAPVTREETVNASTQTFISALVFNSAIAGASLIAFTIVRRWARPVYEPRTFVPDDERKRAPPLSTSLLGWPLALWKVDSKLVLERYGSVDAYVFLRFLRLMVRILVPIWVLSWTILLPVDAAGTSNAANEGLDRFTFGNIGPRDQARYAAHLVLLYVFTGWILINLWIEMRQWLLIRQRHLVSPAHSQLPQARTVLFTGIPRQYLDEARLQQLFEHVPGGTEHIWLNRNLEDMPHDFNARLEASQRLEKATVALIRMADKLRRKAEKAAGKRNAPPLDSKWTTMPTACQVESELTLAERLVPAGKRPHHRLRTPNWLPFSLPFVGQKVDSIAWCQEQIVEREACLEAKRSQLEEDISTPGTGEGERYPPLSSAFVLFRQQIGAHLAYRAAVHHAPYLMHERFIETAPGDVIWSNLSINPYDRAIRRLLSAAATAVVIIFWAIPVAFVGAVSNVPNLCRTYSWLSWLCDLPTPVPGIIAGILPPALLALLFMALPVIFRLFARYEGVPRSTAVELSLMTRYFAFLVIQGFIVVTLSSGIILRSGREIANLPGASTFFLTFITLRGLAGSAGVLIQYSELATYYVKLFLLGSTPRAVYRIRLGMHSIQWGTVFPDTTLLVVITIAYSIISPIINGLACVAFILLFFAHKYLFVWVLDQPAWAETGGLFFPKAVDHVFVGLYLEQICLAALFFLARDEDGQVSAIPEGALSVALLVATAFFHFILRDSFSPLKEALPLTLAHRSFGMPVEAGHMATDLAFDTECGAKPFAKLRGKLARRHTRARAFDDEGEGESEDAARGEIREAPGMEVGSEEFACIRRATLSAFIHPAAHVKQQTVWIPSDRLGIGEDAVRRYSAGGVQASTRGAILSERGKVRVEESPPDEDQQQV